ncbi:MAG: hypothetical protein ACLFUB_18125 [Cyclobacteriaceae bacterium]
MRIKYKIKTIVAFSLLAMLGWACEENEDFLAFEKAPSVITFDGYPAFSADFSVLDQVVIPVNAPGASEIQVIRDISYSAGGSTNNINETLTTLQGPEAELNVPISQIIANPDNVGALGIGSTDLLFQVTENGQTTYRRFSLDFYNPLTVEAPEETFNDSIISVSYAVDAVNAEVAQVQVFLRDTTEGEFSATPLESFTAVEGNIDVTVPSEAIASTEGDIGLRFVVTSADGMTASQTVSIEVLPVPLDDATEVILEANGNTLDFSAQDTVATGGDLQLLVMDDDDELQLAALGGSDFILAEEGFDFEGASFQDLRDTYMEGTPQTELEDIGNLPSNQVLIVRLADAAAGSASEYAAVQVGNLVRGFDIGDSELSLLYRTR